jgi:mannosylfructose-phosphate synthase
MLSVHGYFDPIPILGATDTGGQVTYVLELSKHLAELDIAVDIYTRRFSDRSEVEPVSKNVRVVRIPCGGDDFIRKEELFPHLDEFVENMSSYMDQNDLRYDLIHSHYWDAGYIGMKMAERLQVPSIYTAHSLGAWKKEQMGGDPEEMEREFNFTERIKWEHVIFDNATAQTVTTLDGQETYKRLYDFESENMVIIPPGVDTKRFRPLRSGEEDKALDVPGRFVFALSRIDSNKGLDFLIRAFERIKSETDAHLVIGGGSKNPKPHEVQVKNELLDIVRAFDLRDRVTFTGYVPDELLDPYYRQCEVFVLPSKYEPFGMTVLEAMACGTAVIATKLGGIRHVLTDEQDSLLVDPSDPKQLGDAMVKLLTDEAYANGIASRGLKTIEERFSWESIAARTLAFYERYTS